MTFAFSREKGYQTFYCYNVSAKFDETLKEENICAFSHDSLNLHGYTHFTSQIQYYFDIIICAKASFSIAL